MGSPQQAHSGNIQYKPSLFGVLVAILLLAEVSLFSQNLEPRSVTNVPIGTNFAVLSYNYSQGNILYDPALTLEDMYARINTMAGAWVRSYSFFGMGAKTSIILPFATGVWDVNYQGEEISGTRTGLADLRLNFSFNFLGSPALTKSEYREFRQKTIAGFSMQTAAGCIA